MTVPALVLALLAAILLSGYFSGIETGYYSINKLRLQLRRDAGDRQARRVWRHLSRHSWLIAVILAGNNLVNLAATNLGLELLVRACPACSPELMGTLLMTPVLFLGGEVLPKAWFRSRAETLTYTFSLGITLAGRLLWPLVALLQVPAALAARLAKGGGVLRPLAGREGLQALLGESSEAGLLTRVQAELGHGLIHLETARVADAMVRLREVVMVPEDLGREAFLEQARVCPFRRFPVHEPGRPDQVVGYVHLHDLLYDDRPDAAVEGHLRRLERLPEEMAAGQALELLQRRRQPLALVMGRHGQPVGLVTVTDLVDEATGRLTGGT